MSDGRAQQSERERGCDHICLRPDGHDGIHLHGYEHPSPRDAEARALAAEAERDRWKERAEKAAWLAEQDACALAAAEAERDRLERQVTGAEMTRSREYVRRCAAEATVSRQQERIEELEVTLEEIRDQHGFSYYTYGEMIPVCRCGRTLDGCPTYQFCEDLAELSAALEGTPDG